MTTPLPADLELDRSLPDFTPERRSASLDYASVVCPCGGRRFHLAGWTRISTAGGSFFWRSVTRVWREARVALEDGEPAESPFWLPCFLTCDACGRDFALFDGEEVVGRWPSGRRDEPKEAFRCRVCRRGSLEVVVGQAVDPLAPERMGVELQVRCSACHRQHRVAWADGRPSEQERRLDELYGRR